MPVLARLEVHPGVAILAWLMLAAAAGWAGIPGLALLTVAAAVATPWLAFSGALRRLSWLLVALLAVYAYATPGAAIVPSLDLLSPTREGLVAGLVQAWRIALVVALLLGATGGMERGRLLSGFHALLAPLAHFGVAVDRVTVRLALTLDYAADLARLDAREVLAFLGGQSHSLPSPAERVVIERPRMRSRDWAVLGVCAMLALAAIAVGPSAGDWVTGLA